MNRDPEPGALLAVIVLTMGPALAVVIMQGVGMLLVRIFRKLIRLIGKAA